MGRDRCWAIQRVPTSIITTPGKLTILKTGFTFIEEKTML
jgi:hypothetical protein